MTSAIHKIISTAAALSLLSLSTAPALAGPFDGMISKAMNNHGSGPVYYEHQEGFKGLSQAVLGQFSVVFINKKVDRDGGGFWSGNDKAKVIAHLTGATEADLQHMTDAIYADFQKKLTASGISLVDPAAYYASKYYQKVKTEEQGHKVTINLQGDDNADGVAFWPSGMTNRDNIALVMRFMDFNASNVYTAQYDYARTAKIPVLNVVYVVDFAEPAKSNGGGLLQSVKVSSELAISNRGSLIYLMDTNGKPAKMILNKPIVEAGSFAEIKDITSGATKTVESAQNIMNIGGALFGKGHPSGMFGKKLEMNRRFEYAITDIRNYDEMVIHAGGQANDLMLGQLAAVK
ncbi:MAG: hypothetical protein RLY97_39 [Pseudomonadota bacterium]|jgi:hypothetical protein